MDWYTAGTFLAGFVCWGMLLGVLVVALWALDAAGPGMLLLWFLVLVGVLFGVSCLRRKKTVKS